MVGILTLNYLAISPSCNEICLMATILISTILWVKMSPFLCFFSMTSWQGSTWPLLISNIWNLLTLLLGPPRPFQRGFSVLYKRGWKSCQTPTGWEEFLIEMFLHLLENGFPSPSVKYQILLQQRGHKWQNTGLGINWHKLQCCF